MHSVAFDYYDNHASSISGVQYKKINRTKREKVNNKVKTNKKQIKNKIKN